MYCRRQLVDFESNGSVFERLGVRVVAASTDAPDESAALAERLQLADTQLLGGIDARDVARKTGALLNEGDAPFLHATGFLIDPEGTVVSATFSSGPIGRLTAQEVARRVAGALRSSAQS